MKPTSLLLETTLMLQCHWADQFGGCKALRRKRMSLGNAGEKEYVGCSLNSGSSWDPKEQTALKQTTKQRPGLLISPFETHPVFKPRTDANANTRREDRAGAAPASPLYKHQGVLPDSEQELSVDDPPGLQRPLWTALLNMVAFGLTKKWDCHLSFP